MQPIKYETIEFDQFHYSDCKKAPNGSKMVYMYYGNNYRNLTVQTPFLLCPFGIGTFNDKECKYFIDLSFTNSDKNNDIEQFLNFVYKFDNQILNDAIALRHIWFGENVTEDQVRAMYKPFLRKNYNEAKKYPPTIKLKLLRRGPNDYSAAAFDEKKNPISIDDSLKKNSKVKGIIELCGIWFTESNFGTTWKMNQMIIKDDINIHRIYAFIDDDSESDTDELSESSDTISNGSTGTF